MVTSPFNLKTAESPFSGLIISCPHAGREFPENAKQDYPSELVANPVDTDWFVETLYDFAPAMGIPLLWGRYSRYVIDLNRALDEEKLYQDQRLQTGLIPRTTFAGEKLFKDGGPDAAELAKRVRDIYEPYHRQLQTLAKQIRETLGYVLILEGHSIKRLVPTISIEPFPDIILGNHDGKTLPDPIFNIAEAALLTEGKFTIAKNHPFKGGFITRSFARPSEKQFTLQLEMSQDLYMDESAFKLLPEKAQNIKRALSAMIKTLCDAMKENYGH